MDMPPNDVPIFYNTAIEERFWKAEIMLEPCEVCEGQKLCFSIFLDQKAQTKMTEKRYRAIKNCPYRTEIINEAFELK